MAKKIKKRKKLQASSSKLQAASLTMDQGQCRMNIMNDKQLKRIADAIEEILRLVKKDMENIKEAAK